MITGERVDARLTRMPKQKPLFLFGLELNHTYSAQWVTYEHSGLRYLKLNLPRLQGYRLVPERAVGRFFKVSSAAQKVKK